VKWTFASIGALEVAALGALLHWGILLRPLRLAAPVLQPDTRYVEACQWGVWLSTAALVGISISAAVFTARMPGHRSGRRRALGVVFVGVPIACLVLFQLWLHVA
jgi:hypothetical protein